MLGPQTGENQSRSQMSRKLYQLLKSLRNARRPLRCLLIYHDFFQLSVCAERFSCRLRIDVTGPSALGWSLVTSNPGGCWFEPQFHALQHRSSSCVVQESIKGEWVNPQYRPYFQGNSLKLFLDHFYFRKSQEGLTRAVGHLDSPSGSSSNKTSTQHAWCYSRRTGTHVFK